MGIGYDIKMKMPISAIVDTSNTGLTKEYALFCYNEPNVPCFHK